MTDKHVCVCTWRHWGIYTAQDGATVWLKVVSHLGFTCHVILTYLCQHVYAWVGKCMQTCGYVYPVLVCVCVCVRYSWALCLSVRVAVCVSHPCSCPLALRCSGCWIIMRRQRVWACHAPRSTATTCYTARSRNWSPSMLPPSENSSAPSSWAWGRGAWVLGKKKKKDTLTANIHTPIHRHVCTGRHISSLFLEGTQNITTMGWGLKLAPLCSGLWRTNNTWQWGSSPSPKNRGNLSSILYIFF